VDESKANEEHQQFDYEFGTPIKSDELLLVREQEMGNQVVKLEHNAAQQAERHVDKQSGVFATSPRAMCHADDEETEDDRNSYGQTIQQDYQLVIPPR
jgi:hypothetical protein